MWNHLNISAGLTLLHYPWLHSRNIVKKIAVLFVLLTFTKVSVAQNTDSLITELQKAKEDTNKVNLYWKTGVSIIYQEPFKALPYFKNGIELSQKLNFISGLEKCNNAASLAFSFNAKYDSALVYIEKAVYYAVKAGNIKRLSLAYLNRADVFVNLQNYPAALKDCDSAIVYATQIKNNDGLGRIYSIMNGIYRDLKQYDKALTALDKSDYHFSFTKNRQMVAMNYSERADILVQTKRYDTAVYWYKKAITIADSLEDINNLSAYYSAMGEAFAGLKNYQQAETALIKALNYALQSENTSQQAVCYTNLSTLELEQNHFQKSIEYGLKSYELIKPETDLLREQLITQTLATAYFKHGNTDKGLEFLEISNGLKDSLVKQQFSAETAKQQAAFDVKEKEREITVLNKDKELQQQKLQKQRLLIFGSAFIALLSLVAIWSLINRNKLKQKMKELELRNQIAADLHDEVGSSLSSIHLLSQMAAQPGSNAAQKNILEKMSVNAKETMEKMSDLVWTIKPEEAEGSNLKQRMERFAYEICGAKNITVDLRLDKLDTKDLNMEQRKNMYLIFKEALNNAVKYSGTDKLHISAVNGGNLLTMIVRDEGKGFDINSITKGNGLDNIKSRAVSVGGTINITSAPDNGTEVKLTLPLKR
jgi:two-component system, NarL family, sensor histidine kinase UhpB